MRIPLGAAAAAALLALVARPGRAEPPPEAPPGPVLAVRLAVAPATGSAARDVPMSDAVRLQFPVQLDALWRFGHAAAGAYASWGLARSRACDGSCASVTRAGLQATWTFAPWRGAEPWAGIGTGYEWASERQGSGTRDVRSSWRGFELFAAQGGLEWRVAPSVALGPFLLAAAARYTTFEVETDYGSASAELAHKAVHGWFHAGVRARLVLGGER